MARRFLLRKADATRSFHLLHFGERRTILIWMRTVVTVLLVSLPVGVTRAEDEQYKYTPEQQKSATQPSSPAAPNYNYQAPQYPQYQAPQYPQYQPPKQPQYPAYQPPKAPQYPQYQPPKAGPGQYPQYPNYQAPKGPPGQYRGSQHDQQACINDVFRLCNQFVPDVQKIISCLQSNRKNLSPPCRAVFSRGRKGR